MPRTRPIDAGNGHVVNGTLAFYGIIVTLYNDDYWSLLTQALAEVMTPEHRVPAAPVRGRVPGPHAGRRLHDATRTWRSPAINCLDYPTTVRDYEQMLAFRDQVAKVAPTFADWFAMSPGCEAWPFQSTRDPAPDPCRRRCADPRRRDDR